MASPPALDAAGGDIRREARCFERVARFAQAREEGRGEDIAGTGGVALDRWEGWDVMWHAAHEQRRSLRAACQRHQGAVASVLGHQRFVAADILDAEHQRVDPL